MKTIRTALFSRWSLLLLLLALSPMACQGGCEDEKKEDDDKNEESASSESTPEAGPPAGAKVVDKVAEPTPPASQDEFTALMTKGPAKLHLGTAALTVPTVAKQHGFLQVKPVIESGLSDIVLNALPADAKQGWKTAIEEFGFNPLEAIDGGVLWSNGDAYDKLGDPGADSFLIVVGKKGLLNSAIITALKDTSDDNATPFDDPHLTGYFSDPMTPAQIAETRSLLTATFKRTSPDAETFDHAYDDTHILIGRSDKKVVVGYYLSPNGVAVTTTTGSGKEDVTKKLAPFFKRINAAASLDGYPKDFSAKTALNLHLTRKNEVIDGRLDLGRDVELSLSVPKEAVDLPGETEQFIAAWNIVKLAPEKILQGADIPAVMRPMLVKLIRGTDLSIDRGTIRATVRIPVSDVKDGLAQMTR